MSRGSRIVSTFSLDGLQNRFQLGIVQGYSLDDVSLSCIKYVYNMCFNERMELCKHSEGVYQIALDSPQLV